MEKTLTGVAKFWKIKLLNGTIRSTIFNIIKMESIEDFKNQHFTPNLTAYIAKQFKNPIVELEANSALSIGFVISIVGASVSVSDPLSLHEIIIIDVTIEKTSNSIKLTLFILFSISLFQ